MGKIFAYQTAITNHLVDHLLRECATRTGGWVTAAELDAALLTHELTAAMVHNAALELGDSPAHAAARIRAHWNRRLTDEEAMPADSQVFLPAWERETYEGDYRFRLRVSPQGPVPPPSGATNSSAVNPPWARDELILALDLYIRRRPHLPRRTDPEVIELSTVLNALPIHVVRPNAVKFRNPNGVAMKLANFAARDPSYTGKALDRGGRLEESVWADFHSKPAELHQLADQLRAMAADRVGVAAQPEDDEEDVDASEGLLLYRAHRTRERRRDLVEKRKRQAKGNLTCEVCGFDYGTRYGALGDGFIEVHHKLPLSVSGQTRTKLSDLALVCANCHRMLHRRRPWATVDELRTMLNTPTST